MTEHPALTYSSYLHLDELLASQQPVSEGPEHDELLFIVIHQVYELWFKVLLHELARLQERLEAGDAAAALQTMKRVLTILKTVVAQIDVLETMTPLEFSSFRGRLDRASGFQSAQFRELDDRLGVTVVARAARCELGVFGRRQAHAVGGVVHGGSSHPDANPRRRWPPTWRCESAAETARTSHALVEMLSRAAAASASALSRSGSRSVIRADASSSDGDGAGVSAT
jgi:tryptophan 2,3-dioxygenase